jgi:pimeloyl-ACP methyl ester carboxylesterase
MNTYYQIQSAYAYSDNRRPRCDPRNASGAGEAEACSGSYDATARLGEITQPTLVVHGRADRIAPVALAREMHDAIPGSRFALLPGCHLIALLPHRQRRFVAAVLGFLPPSKPPAAA